jgi:hypothetical protein
MILDAQNSPSGSVVNGLVVGQAVTVTAVSTNAIDLWAGQAAVQTVPLAAYAPQAGGAPIQDQARGNLVEIVCQVTTQFTAAGAATLQVQLITADDLALTTNVTTLQETAAIGKATLVPGYRFRIGCALPPGATQRFLGLNYIVATGPMTAGNIVAFLAIDSQDTFVG